MSKRKRQQGGFLPTNLLPYPLQIFKGLQGGGSLTLSPHQLASIKRKVDLQRKRKKQRGGFFPSFKKSLKRTRWYKQKGSGGKRTTQKKADARLLKVASFLDKKNKKQRGAGFFDWYNSHGRKF